MSGSGGGRKVIPTRRLPVNKSPSLTRCITLTIPDDDEYERDLFSTIYDGLAMWLCWQRDQAKSGTTVAKLWKASLRTWRRCSLENVTNTAINEVDMPFFRIVCVGDKTYLEFQTCSCPETWARLALESEIVPPSQSPGPSPQPGPGGGVAQYCRTLDANNRILLPTVVNSGDVLTLNSATGAGNDGGEVAWRCPSGLIFFADACSGFTTTHVGDPIPDHAHMSIIVEINGSFYPFYPGLTITVPGGVVNQNVTVQVNDSDLTNNSGSYQLCITVKNNQAAIWAHTFDFTINDGGFTFFPGTTNGTWIPGVGWQSTEEGGSPDLAGFRITRNITPTIFDGVQEITTAIVNCRLGNDGEMRLRLSGATVLSSSATVGDGGSFSGNIDTIASLQNTDAILLGSDVYSSGGSLIISRAIFRGKGTDPFA